MFSSTIISTIARPTLARAVESVLSQDCPEAWEVVVVNDSGSPLPAADWQDNPRVRIVHTQRRERGVARNTGAALAQGRYLHFLDDDWLLPGALRRTWERAQSAGDAVCLAGGCQVVDGKGQVWGEIDYALEGNCATQLLTGTYLAIGSYFVRSDTFSHLGGFHWNFVGREDFDLAIRMALVGDLAHIGAPVVAILRGVHWTTATDYGPAVEELRLIRDLVLDLPGVYGRLQSSAHSAYWQGRVVHAYLSSCLLNWRRRRPFKLLSRSLFAGAAMLAGGTSLASGDFWRGVMDDQIPGSWSEVLERIDRAMAAAS